MSQTRYSKDGLHALLVLILLLCDLLMGNVLSPLKEISTLWVVLALLPTALLFLDIIWQVRGIRLTLVVALLLTILGYFLIPNLEFHISRIYLIQNVAINIALGWWFGGSLWKGRVPLCTRIASQLHPNMHPQLLKYTRAITFAWTVFFIIIASASLILYSSEPLTIWSIFANGLMFPLVMVMFVIEYGIRRLVLPKEDLMDPMKTWRAYRQIASKSRVAQNPLSED